MPNSPTFSVAGMSSSTGVHHSPNLNAWGTASTSTTTPFGDSLAQSRSHYQPGYLMSASQNNNAPQGNQRVDEIPVVQTKAKMSQVMARGSASEFGMESMFQSTTRQRQTLADEDAPPMSSINDIPNEFNVDSKPAPFQPRNSTLNTSPFARRHTQTPSSASQASQAVYIIVFGYPADKYSATAEYFKSLGSSTDPDQNMEIVNCFRIGYHDIGDAMRAVRKNGDILGGNWMIGVKWADPAQAEALLGQPMARGGYAGPIPEQNGNNNAMAVDEPSPPPPSSTPTVGTPIRLAPPSAAFRRTGAPPKPATPQPQKAAGTSGLPSALPPPPNNTPNKGVLGQVSDLIFGW